MGVQASAVNEMGLTQVSTTFLTGTLTGLVSSLVSPGKETPHGPRRFGVLIGLAVGANLSGLLSRPRRTPSRPCRWPPSSPPSCWPRAARNRRWPGLSDGRRNVTGGVSMSP